MTQDQYGQAGGSGYGVRDDAVPDDDADDNPNKTVFQKVASALRGDRTDRDETAPAESTRDRDVTGETVTDQGDMPTNPDVPPAGVSWGEDTGGGATGASAMPASGEGLGAQDTAGTVPADTVPGDTVPGDTVPGGTQAGVAGGSGASQRDYWDEPAGSAAGEGINKVTYNWLKR
jgi:hypothetical protein